MWLIEAIKSWLYFRKKNTFCTNLESKKLDLIILRNEVKTLTELQPDYIKYLRNRYL